MVHPKPMPRPWYLRWLASGWIVVACLGVTLKLATACGDTPPENTNDAGSSVDSGNNLLANGGTCTSDSQCQSGQCECLDFDCVTRVCANATCLCGYGTSGSCTDALRTGTKDPQDCDSTGVSCQGVGQCQ